MKAGIGLRHPYYKEILDRMPAVGWLEIHPENYFGGGAPRHFLERCRALYPVSFHAVGLSLGSDQLVCGDHLRAIRELIDAYDPFLVSDHASWSASGNAHLGDLLPLPYTDESLGTLCRNIERTQEILGRRILIENPSTYVGFAADQMDEATFLNEAARRTGCGLLLDVNNIYVQAHNHGYDAFAMINAVNPAFVQEIHLAGHTQRETSSRPLLVDTHNRPVCEDVWDLYAHAITRFGAVPSLIEWDADFPSLDVLIAQAQQAQAIAEKALRRRTYEAA